MISGAEEVKPSEEVVSYVSSRGRDLDHEAQAIPDDIWSLLLQYSRTADSIALSSTCSWLRNSVLSNMTSILLPSTASSFPATRLTSLLQVSLTKSVFVPTMLPALLDCPQLRELQVACEGELREVVMTNLPLFPRLQRVKLSLPTVDGRLGKALASCALLQHVELTMGAGSDRDVARKDFVSDFLSQLASLSGLRSLAGLCLRDEDDSKQLCTSLRAWSELQELRVMSNPDRLGWYKLFTPLHGIAAAVRDCCPRIRTLSLVISWTSGSGVKGEDLDVIASLKQLRKLTLSGELPAASLARLCALTQLQELKLDKCTVGEEAVGKLVALIGELPLTSLSICCGPWPTQALCAILRAVETHGSLAFVELVTGLAHKPSAAESRELAVALATAVCFSPVRRWNTFLRFCLRTFLATWDGRTPVAAMTELWLRLSDSMACEGVEHAELLLRCVRSCQSLRRVCCYSLTTSGDAIHAVVAAVRKEPLIPTALILQLSRESREQYLSVSAELKACGLELW
eukprot:PLAT6893.4.p1 GENE.PLAT6893.4~~PLAT6893.4.p1  ORF type:complete len:516 (-),score=60.52 PLAT6893.4:358-1905(-)